MSCQIINGITPETKIMPSRNLMIVENSPFCDLQFRYVYFSIATMYNEIDTRNMHGEKIIS